MPLGLKAVAAVAAVRFKGRGKPPTDAMKHRTRVTIENV
jgi:hypothetical protein